MVATTAELVDGAERIFKELPCVLTVPVATTCGGGTGITVGTEVGGKQTQM
jgi:hypothetical protein